MPFLGSCLTNYVYGTATGGVTPQIYRNDLLRAVIYPDSDDPTDLSGNGTDGDYDRVEYKYNRQGERIWMKDQTETEHEYTYDSLGRQTADAVTTLGTDVDGAVRRIERSYNPWGTLKDTVSYDAATSGNVVNDVELEYDDMGLLDKEYQEHEGAKDGNTLYVQYNYDDTESSDELTKGLRPKSVRYPNARLIHYTYGSSGSTADYLNRLDAIKQDNGGSPGTTLSAYTYLGLGTMVIEDFQEPDVKLDYFGGTSGTYAGFDIFGRVVDQKWYDYGASATRDQYTYGYDRAGNRNYRENTGPSAKDEYYTYDGIYRLKNFDRGDLNAGKTAISGTPVREEDFTLDPLGNWTDYIQKTSGTTDLDQDRTHNKVNEITDITESQGDSQWITPAHDRAGNMTTAPKPSSPTNGLTCKYDAWNRLVQVDDDDAEVTVAKYEYDGLHRRIKKHLDSQSPSSPNGIDSYVHYFYNSTWQVLETRDTTTESDQPESLQPKYQYIYSPRYIDAPILRDENTDQDGLCDDDRIYYLTDANFNVTCLVDAAGDAQERYLYDPYGDVTIYDGGWSNTRSVSQYYNATLYTGRSLDDATGLYCYRARFYDTHLGRFITRDRRRYIQVMNLYEYVGSDRKSVV